MKLIDISGQKFDKLTVLSREPNRPGQKGGSWWNCLCECGNTCSRQGSMLRGHRNFMSCGCQRSAIMAEVANRPSTKLLKAKAITRHGERKRTGSSVEYKTWLAMKSRCYRHTDKSYQNWGGRGIKVCERWKDSFENFLEDMGRRPSTSHSIDRINPYGNYSPDNCRWATNYEQVSENLRRAIPVVYNGISFPTIAAACRFIGIRPSTVNLRMKAGVALEDALKPGRPIPRRSKESYLRKDDPRRSK